MRLFVRWVVGFAICVAGCANSREQPVGPDPVSSPPMHEKVLKGMAVWDIDANGNADRPTVDLWWNHITASHRALVPRNGAGLAVVNGRRFEDVTKNDLKGLRYSTDWLAELSANPTIQPGMILAVRTNEGAYVKLLITGFASLDEPGGKIDKYDLKLRYVVYGKQD